jgi:hypothetical protein
MDAERGEGLQAAQPFLAQRIGVEAVRDDADLVAARRKLVGEIVDVSEEPADRRAEDQQDAQRSARRCRHNHRSPMTTVSPG